MLVEEISIGTCRRCERWGIVGLAHLLGECDYAEFVEKGLAATRQLAKRQLTWLRKWPDALGVVSDDPEDAKYRATKVERLIPSVAATLLNCLDILMKFVQMVGFVAILRRENARKR